MLVATGTGLLRHLRARGVPSWFLGVNTEAHVRVCHRVGGCAVLTDSLMWLARVLRGGSLPSIRALEEGEGEGDGEGGD